MIPPPSSISSANDIATITDTIDMGIRRARGRMNPETVKKTNNNVGWSVQNREASNQSE